MKKHLFLTLFCLLTAFFGISSASAKKLNLKTDLVYFYGVDFAQVRTAGIDDKSNQIVKAFVGINELLAEEWREYDFSKVLEYPVVVKTDAMTKRARKMDTSTMRIGEVSGGDVANILKSYKFKDKGVGMVLIARLLDKTRGEGTFDVVLFDIKKRKVIFEKRVTKDAGRGNLRNCWVHPIQEMTRDKKLFND